MKVAPAATVIGLLKELVVGGVGNTLVAARRSNLFSDQNISSDSHDRITYGSAETKVARRVKVKIEEKQLFISQGQEHLNKILMLTHSIMINKNLIRRLTWCCNL